MSGDSLLEAGRRLGALEPVGDTDATVHYVVSGTPDGKLEVGIDIAGGHVESLTEGKPSGADITVTLAYDVVRSLLDGEVTADAAYMRGAVKVEGAHAVWLLDLRDLRTAAFDALADLLD